MDTTLLITIVLIFVAAFLLSENILASLFGPQQAEAKRVKKRLEVIAQTKVVGRAGSLLRETASNKQTALGLWMNTWPVMPEFNRRLQASGSKISAPMVLLISLALGAGAFVVVWMIGQPVFAFVAGGAGLILYPVKINLDYNRRLNKFEENLPEALDVIIRALKAGQPFNESLLLVAEELEGPVAEEFGLTFAEINYGLDHKQAFGNMMKRMPSVSLKAMIVAVLLQRVTGGNLAEVLQSISGVLRGRFKFHRKVRTLSAEGRLSAAILIAVPFVLFGMISLSKPGYVAPLLETPTGERLLIIGGILMVIGILWIRKVIRIDV